MQRGFSLVELSIVLVILGLLTGGILAGQSLIRAAELRKVSQGFTRLQTAIYTFRDKYQALPGDMLNAYAFWGVAAGCTNAVNMTTAAGCNGDGDGSIEDNGATSGEDLRAPQFLALAGLIEGSFTGVVEPTGNKRKIGINIITGPLSNTTLWLNQLAASQWGATGNNIALAVEGATTPAASNILVPEEAWGIDSKLDDGKPTTGVLTLTTGQTSCFSGTDYILTTTSKVCGPIFWLR